MERTNVHYVDTICVAMTVYFLVKQLCNFLMFLFTLGDVLLKPIIEAAGKDITNWFDKKTKDVCI